MRIWSQLACSLGFRIRLGSALEFGLQLGVCESDGEGEG